MRNRFSKNWIMSAFTKTKWKRQREKQLHALAEQMDALVALRKKVKESDTATSSNVTFPSRASSVEKGQLDFTKEVDMSCENNIKPASSSNNEDPSLKEHGRTPSDVLECVKNSKYI
nr:uncharacterized protein LOC117272971 [Nicotiana tomentosiformis]